METANSKPGKKHKQEVEKEDAPLKAIPSERVSQRTVITQSPKAPSADDTPLSHSQIKVGPPRGARKKPPTQPQLPPPSSAPTPTVMQHHLPPTTRAPLEASDRMMAEPSGCRKSSERGENPADKKGKASGPPSNFSILVKTNPVSFVANPSPKWKLSVLKTRPSLSPDTSDVKTISPKSKPKCEAPTVSTDEASGASGKARPSKKAPGDLKVRVTNIEANMLMLHGLLKKAEVELREAMMELRELQVSLE